MRVLFVFMIVLALCCGCNEAIETGEQGGANAVGIAENMSGGTVGDADLESGEAAEESGEEAAEEGGE